MYAFKNAALPQARLPGIEHTTLACGDSGTKLLSVWQQRMEAGCATPPHSHDCEEVVTVLAGRGRLLFGENEIVEFEADSTLVLPAGLNHQIINCGEEALITIAVLGATPAVTRSCDGAELPLPWPT